jgi:AAA family ATP:ADP antiporter
MPLVASFIIAAFMAGAYRVLLSRLPRRWGPLIVQGGMVAVLVLFWFLFKTGSTWVAVAFYLWGLLLGILLTSQFWTLANVTYDPRQAKRLFGFIGAGAPLGGMAAGLITYYAGAVGTFNLVLISAAILAAAVAIVMNPAREKPVDVVGTAMKRSVWFRTRRDLRESKHLQITAIAISFAARR